MAMLTSIGLPLMLVVQGAATPAEPARLPSYGMGVDVRSGHEDRGFVISERPVVQPVAWVSRGVAEFWVWGNLPLAENADGTLPQIVETELALLPKVGRLKIGPAIRMFVYHDPRTAYSTRSVEAWLYLSYDAGPFRLVSAHSFDIHTYPGAYFGSAGIEFERHMSQRLAAGASFGGRWASATFNDAYAGVARAAFDGISAEGWMTAYMAPHVYIGPVFDFAKTLDPRVRAGLVRPSFLFVGLTTGVEF